MHWALNKYKTIAPNKQQGTVLADNFDVQTRPLSCLFKIIAEVDIYIKHYIKHLHKDP